MDEMHEQKLLIGMDYIDALVDLGISVDIDTYQEAQLEEYYPEIQDALEVSEEEFLDVLTNRSELDENINSLLPDTTYTVSGSVLWTDIGGQEHPAKNIEVDVFFFVETDMGYTVLSATDSVMTDEDGSYETTFSGNDDLDYKVIAEIKCIGSNVKVTPDLDETTFYAKLMDPVYCDTDEYLFDMGEYLFDLTTDEGTAMQIQQAGAMASEYMKSLNGEYPEEVIIRYPFAGDSSRFVQNRPDGTILLTERRKCQWDVIQHEFAHYVCRELNILYNPGGEHFYNESVLDYSKDSIQYEKSRALSIAWGEAVATYLMDMTQFCMSDMYDAPVYIADTEYNETVILPENCSLINDAYYRTCYNIEIDDTIENEETSEDTETDDNNLNMGEASEVAVGRFLAGISGFYMLDRNSISDRVQILSQINQAWNALTYQKNDSFSEFYEMYLLHYVTDFSSKKLLGEMLSKYGMSANETTSVLSAYTLVPEQKSSSVRTFQWDAGGGSERCPNNYFKIVFYDETGNVLNDVHNNLSNPRVSISSDEWFDMIDAVDGGKILWQVFAGNTEEPATGPYESQMGVIDTSVLDFTLDAPIELQKASTMAYKIYVAWRPVQDAGGYRVYRSESENGHYKYLSTTTTFYYEDTDVTAGSTFYYKVRTVRGTRFSDYSEAKCLSSEPEPTCGYDHLVEILEEYAQYY